MIVCLDPGHGGADPGGRSLVGPEKNLVLNIQPFVWKALSDAGHRVLTTRVNDEFVSLTARAAFANSQRADCFISLHGNASENPNVSGAWTIYASMSSRGQKLAQLIQRELAKTASSGDRNAVYPDASSWVGNRRLAVLRQTSMPAVIVELGFMTNAVDAKLLISDNWAREAGRAIASAVGAWS